MLAVVTFTLYAGTLAYPLVFDDRPSILENPTIRQLWPLSVPMQPPRDGSTVTNRPLLNLTFAANYAVHGLHVGGYRLTNLFIHSGSALLLFGLVRRTLLRLPNPWPEPKACGVAGTAALLWVVHPLHTESVTYVSQRAESLAGLLMFAVLYGFVRATDPAARAPRAWLALSLGLGWMGMTAKETFVAVPLLLLLYDRTFVAGSFRDAWRRRWRVHAGFAGAWLVLGALILGSPTRGESVGFSADVSPWTSLLTQSDALVLYVKRAFWPDPLVFDYGTSFSDRITRLSAVLPQVLVVLVLLAGTGIALVKHPPVGFLGAAFFLVLAPSSSVVPILSQVRAEHRMYVPLAAMTVLVVVAVIRITGRWGWLMLGLAGGALALTTAARQRDYATPRALWADTVRKVPGNPRAHYNLAHELAAAGDTTGAVAAYSKAAELDPGSLMTRVNLATLLLALGRPAEAREHAEAAVRIDPRSAAAHSALGRSRVETRDLPGALTAFDTAVQLRPDDAGMRRNLGLALLHLGRTSDALRHLRDAAEAQSDPELWLIIAGAQHRLGAIAEARRSLETAVELRPNHPVANFELGNLLAAEGDYERAILHYQRAIEGMPQAVPPRVNLAIALEHAGRLDDAIRVLDEVSAFAPGDAEVRRRLEHLQRLRTLP